MIENRHILSTLFVSIIILSVVGCVQKQGKNNSRIDESKRYRVVTYNKNMIDKNNIESGSENVAPVRELCSLPLFNDDVIDKIVVKINKQRIVCDSSYKNGVFSINGVVVSHTSTYEMSELIRENVRGCQNFSEKDVAFYPKRNNCVIALEREMDYFVSATKDSRMKFLPSPFNTVVSKDNIGSMFTDFRFWANYAILKSDDSYSRDTAPISSKSSLLTKENSLKAAFTQY